MATISLTVADDKIPRIDAALRWRYRRQEGSAALTTVQLVRQFCLEEIRNAVQDAERTQITEQALATLEGFQV